MHWFSHAVLFSIACCGPDSVDVEPTPPSAAQAQAELYAARINEFAQLSSKLERVRQEEDAVIQNVDGIKKRLDTSNMIQSSVDYAKSLVNIPGAAHAIKLVRVTRQPFVDLFTDALKVLAETQLVHGNRPMLKSMTSIADEARKEQLKHVKDELKRLIGDVTSKSELQDLIKKKRAKLKKLQGENELFMREAQMSKPNSELIKTHRAILLKERPLANEIAGLESAYNNWDVVHDTDAKTK